MRDVGEKGAHRDKRAGVHVLRIAHEAANECLPLEVRFHSEQKDEVLSQVFGVEELVRRPIDVADRTFGQRHYGAIDLEVVELLGVDACELGCTPKANYMVHGSGGGRTSITPSLEGRDKDRALQFGSLIKCDHGCSLTVMRFFVIRALVDLLAHGVINSS
jgi:hypothetical protein